MSEGATTGAVRHRPPRGVLLLGATTPLGRSLCAELLADPSIQAVLAVALESWEEAKLPADPRLTYQQVDLTRPRRMHRLLFGAARDLGVDVLVHIAMHRAYESGARVHAQNVEALRWILTLSERHPTLRRLVFRSSVEVYRVQENLPTLITEDHPLDFSTEAPQWVRDRVEADVLACMRMGMSPVEVAVLRCSELLAPGSGSQLHDYLSAPFCLRSAGFDPMLNVLSLEDATRAFLLAIRAGGTQGIFNIPGADTLPLAECIRRSGRHSVPLPGPLLAPAYRLRRRFAGSQFSYRIYRGRFHFAAILDGTRAREVLGYVPQHPLQWPVGP
ncbi:MAG: NAD-dependent epimerase/dehydratase family protein [Myxococcaceae bacterium]|nr:NAD-dependent epimerase/dehydratase family protein [Myxococcaceae bacterium]